MSTQPISLSSLSAAGSGSPLQITGLASGLDTNAIIQALMAIQRQPVNLLTAEQKRIQAQSNVLTTLQTSLQALALSAQALGDPGLFAPSQTVSSSNPSIVSATAAHGVGAVVGGYQVTVSQLASSAQRTYTFASPASGDAITIDGQQITLGANASINDFVNAVNSNSTVDVWATATNANTVVLSDRATGNNATFIQVSDSGGTLTEQSSLAKAGQDAQYTINGTSASSSSNTVAGAIPGVTLTFNGTTTDSGAVGITVGAPGPSASSITAAVNAFVTSYNAMIDQLHGQLTEKTSPTDPTQGTLFGDTELEGFVNNMRLANYTPGAGLPSGMASLADIGITTGAASGTATPSQDAIAGKLTVDATTLQGAIQNNPAGVEKVLQAWSQSFSAVVDNEAGPGGALDSRIQGDGTEAGNLSNQIDDLNAMLNDRQTALQAQFAKLEATLAGFQSQSQWLSGQIASLSANTTH